MIIDDELRDHFLESLTHLEFARDFLRRTGFVEEFNELGWMYGRDWGGGFSEELYDQQLSVMLSLLAPGLAGETFFSHSDDEFWATCNPIDSVWSRENICFDYGFAIFLKGDDPHEVQKWLRFIRWQDPSALIFVKDDETRPHFIWVLVEPMTEEIMQAWNMILVAWEVMQFYDHIADASAWKRLRGTHRSDDGAGTVPAA
jgi:hypothetical protein